MSEKCTTNKNFQSYKYSLRSSSQKKIYDRPISKEGGYISKSDYEHHQVLIYEADRLTEAFGNSKPGSMEVKARKDLEKVISHESWRRIGTQINPTSKIMLDQDVQTQIVSWEMNLNLFAYEETLSP